MDGTLKLSDLTLAFGDPNTSNSPQKRYVDWQLDITIPVKNPKSEPFTIPAGGSQSVFSGSRSILADGTTQWSISLSPLATDRYRFTNIAGTAPGLRTARSVDLNSQSVSWTFNPNLTATLVASASSFSSAQVNDILFVPGPTTGDSTGPMSTMNEGYWVILSISTDGSTVQLARPTGVDFTAATEIVTITATIQVQVFSPTGVLVGDFVNISAGFASSVLGTYTVAAVNPLWFEVISTSPLPIAAVATPGASGIQFFSTAKRYIEMYADQNCVLQLNGDSSNTNTIVPWQAGDINQAGRFVKVGPVWSATVVNKSGVDLNVLLISAE